MKEPRKITKPEIEKLYEFTRKHFVEYYDLQTELVDHLANGMEARWEENPQLGFEENLNLEFKKFGIFGFSDVVEKRQKTMQKKYLRLIWTELISTLRDPKILFFTFLLTGIFTFVALLENGFHILYGGIVLFALVELIYIIKMNFSQRKKIKNKEKIYMLEAMITNIGGMHIFFLLPFYVMNSLDSAGEIFGKGIYFSVIFGLFFSVMILLAYVCFRVLPQKKEEILEKAYPQRKMKV